MLWVTSYRNGLSAGMVSRVSPHPRSRRDVVQGWSLRSTRSNRQFLYSVDPQALTGLGFALTLTLRDCPPSPDDWNRLRRAFVERLRRVGLLRLHWLTEWQRRGVPHFHMAVYFDPDSQPAVGFHEHILSSWLSISSAFSPGRFSQHIEVISDAVGWFQYLSKHAARGVHHYQRSHHLIPQPWRGRTGRVWGRLGSWSLSEPIHFALFREDGGQWAFRRLCRSYRVAQARATGKGSQIAAARRCLSAPTRSRAEVRGVSEWIPAPLARDMAAFLAASGYRVGTE